VIHFQAEEYTGYTPSHALVPTEADSKTPAPMTAFEIAVAVANAQDDKVCSRVVIILYRLTVIDNSSQAKLDPPNLNPLGNILETFPLLGAVISNSIRTT
jgi:hypothetical protein